MTRREAATKRVLSVAGCFVHAILLCALLVAMTYSPTVRAASTPVITLSPGTPGVANTYSIASLTFGSTVAVNSTLTVTFDGGNSTMTYVPSTIGLYPSLVTVYGSAASSLSVQGQQVSVVVPTAISAGTPFSMVFSAAIGITPLTTGTHTIAVSYLGETATGTYTAGSAQNGVAVSFNSITIGKPILGGASDYQFSFTSGVILYPGSTISLQFPSGFTVPTSINGQFFAVTQGNIQLSSFAGYVSISGTTLTLTLPPLSNSNVYSSLAAGVPITVMCGPYTGITNPAVAGTYQFSLWTSLQTTPATKSVVLGTGVTGLSATVTPTVGGSIAEYRLSFAVSGTGALAAGTDKVTVAFPAGFILPSKVPSGAVTVGGTSATAAVSGQNLVVTVPNAVAASANVSIDITAAAGIRNAAGSASGYQLTVTTSADQLPVSSNNLAITASVVTGVSVAVVPGVKGASAAYTFTFTTGLGGALSSGDTITLVLPAGFTVPASIDRTQVALKSPATATSAINPASVSCSTSTRSIVLTLPSGTTIAGGAGVSISLPAVITNPATGGAFTVKVSTSKETTPVDSASFTIYNNPISTLKVTPSSPDGKSGYYTSQPSFTITVDGPAGVTLSAFYRIDEAGAFLSYDVKTSPVVKVPEGKHTVSFYSQDSLGNVEPTHSQQFLVDLTDPVVTVSSLAEKGIVVQPTVAIAGTVKCLDPASVRLTVNGQNTVVGTDGSFSAQVTLSHEGDSTVTLVATSVSGRTSTMTLSVTYIARVTMSLVIGSPTVNLNNEFKTLEAAPFISKKGVTMVPLRFISEAFKATVAWDPVFRSVTIGLNGKTLRVQVGFMTADVNGTSFPLQDAPVIVNGRTFVPLRFIAENFGAQVDWNGALRMVSIIYPKP